MMYFIEILDSGTFIPILQPKYQMIKTLLPSGFISPHQLVKKEISAAWVQPSEGVTQLAMPSSPPPYPPLLESFGITLNGLGLFLFVSYDLKSLCNNAP